MRWRGWVQRRLQSETNGLLGGRIIGLQEDDSRSDNSSDDHSDSTNNSDQDRGAVTGRHGVIVGCTGVPDKKLASELWNIHDDACQLTACS